MMEEEVVKTHVVGIDISIERTTYAILDIRGNILAKESFLTTEADREHRTNDGGEWRILQLPICRH